MTYPVADPAPGAQAVANDPTVDNVLTFPDGIPGFPGYERFVLVEVVPDGAFQRLQSLDDPDMAMYVAVPWLFFPDYAPVLGPAEQADLQIEKADDALVFCPVTVDHDARQIYLNLLGPFVVNAETRRGRQLVLAGSDYPTRAPVEISDG